MQPAACAAPLLLAACLGVCASPPAPDLEATADDPLYTTYAADLERSRFVLDEAYAWVIHDPTRGPDFTTDAAGDLGLNLRVDGVDASRVGDFAMPVRVSESYPDLVVYGYRPTTDLRLEATFFVLSSREALWDVTLANDGSVARSLELAWEVRSGRRPYRNVIPGDGEVFFEHDDPPDAWTLDHHVPHVSHVRNLLTVSGPGTWTGADGATDGASGHVRVTGSTVLEPGVELRVRVQRLVQPADERRGDLSERAQRLAGHPLDGYLEERRSWLQHLELARFPERDDRLLYLSAANMTRQMFYGPEGESSHPWYVFSREPVWGWGHGGQVFHESLTMLAFAGIEPELAKASQYVYEERQHADGYINYRTGAYLNEVILHHDTLTSSAPWYAYTNAEIYRITGDRAFLERMYPSSVRFHDYYTANRDRDGDGLAEWGGHAVLESVRDSRVAVWDEVGWPSNFDGVDVNSMLVREERALASMARALGRPGEAEAWDAAAETRSRLMDTYMWDEDTGFYYNVDRRDNDFTFQRPDDLKRKEIIGFLPLWAGVPDSARAARLVAHLTDPESFWRANGIPTLAADDPYYDPRGYWNGPVWIQWNYLIWRGLRDYGYEDLADELARRNKAAMVERLRAEHNLFEFYDPDSAWAGKHQPYIWAGIVTGFMDPR